MGLTKQRQLFISEYLADLKRNGTQAAIRAGYAEARAKVTASELLKDPEVKASIETQLASRFEKVEVNESMVLADIIAARNACIAAGSGAWQTTGRLRADELLGKHLGMFKDKLEIGLTEELMKLLEAGRERARVPFAPATALVLPELPAKPALEAKAAPVESQSKPRIRGKVRRAIRQQEKTQTTAAWKKSISNSRPK